jgi:hypothetical protein
LSLASDLEEWSRWALQGCAVGTGYPPEAIHESISVPYKHCQSACEQYEDFMSTRAADERTGQRVEAWVGNLHEPMRTAVRVQYVELPDDNRPPHLMAEQWQAKRAAKLKYRLSLRGAARDYTVEQYEAALLLGMDLLEAMRQRWAGGV